ncbi:ABC transporter permease [Novispirillum sp. DQ9]|uniref:ABC transporter permease n=1 Tax=Novispirillum sp. DQ9 TaxID=3398612 RepID=UPI003C7A93EF
MTRDASYIVLAWGDLALASVLLLLNAGLSLALSLGAGRQLLVAGARMVAQLLLMALVLEWLFTHHAPAWTALAAVVMVLFAGREVMARQDRRLAGWWAYGVGTGAMLLASFLVTLFALTTQVRPDPWYDARYAVPLLGMVLGNTMTGVSVGLNSLTTLAVRDRAAIEARLCLGASRWTALRHVTRHALRTGLIGIVNAMAGAGLVFIPGMMTGQILAGADPHDAAKYQILIMFLIAGGTGMGALAAVMLGAWRLTDARHRLRLDRLRSGGG